MNTRLKAQIPFYTMPEALLKIGCALLACVETLPHVIFKKRWGHSQVCKHNVMTHYGMLFHTFDNVCYNPPDQWPFVWEQMTPSQRSTVQTYYCLLFWEDRRTHCVLQSLLFQKFNQICGCRSIHIRCSSWRVESQMNSEQLWLSKLSEWSKTVWRHPLLKKKKKKGILL